MLESYLHYHLTVPSDYINLTEHVNVLPNAESQFSGQYKEKTSGNKRIKKFLDPVSAAQKVLRRLKNGHQLSEEMRQKWLFDAMHIVKNNHYLQQLEDLLNRYETDFSIQYLQAFFTYHLAFEYWKEG